MCSIRALTLLSFALTVCGSQNVSAQVGPASDAGGRIATHAPTPLGGSSVSEQTAFTDNVPISAQPAAPGPSNVVPSEAGDQGGPTRSANYLRNNFGIPETLSDCDKAAEPVTPDMTEPVRDLTIQRNQFARDACRSSWRQHQIEIEEQQRAEDTNRSIQTLHALPSPNSGGEDGNAATVLAEPESNKEQAPACTRDQKALEDIREAVAKGDTAHARLLLDNLIDGVPVDAQNEVDGNSEAASATNASSR